MHETITNGSHSKIQSYSGEVAIPKAVPPRIAYADAFRVLAIAMVLGYHVLSNVHVNLPDRALLWTGIWGVDCFFVLTGFLLSGSFLDAVIYDRAFPDIRKYAIRRFFRIYPLYLFALAISALLWMFVLHHKLSILSLAAHVFMLQGLRGTFVPDINGPLWTMSVDTQFYCVLPFAAFALRSATRKLSVPRRIAAVWISLAMIAFAGLAFRYLVLAHLRAPFVGFDAITAYARNLLGMSPAFALGAAITLQARLNRGRGMSLLSRTASIIIGLAGIAAMVFMTGSHTVTDHDLVPHWLFYDACGAVSAAALLYPFARGAFPVMDHVAGHRAVATLAALAYGVYLFHEPVLQCLLALHPVPLHSFTSAFVVGLALLVIVLPCAAGAHAWVERPFLHLKEKQREPVPTLP